MRPEIQAYFRSVAEQYRVVEHVRFHSIVEKAEWNDGEKVWIVTVLDLKSKQQTVRRAKVLISGVGSLSVPKTCDLPGADTYKGKMFHSAQWDHSFNWKDKDVVVLGMFLRPSTNYILLIPSRQWMFSHPIPAHNGQPTESCPPNHAVCPTSPILI